MAVTVLAEMYVDDYDPSRVPDGPFNPNTLNTSTFLVTVLATINTFLVNYRGKPFMQDLKDNKLMSRCLKGCYFVLFACALDVFPPLNQLLQLSPLPTAGPPIVNLQNNRGAMSEILAHSIEQFGYRTMLCIIMCLDTVLV